MFTIRTRGSTKNLDRFLKKMQQNEIFRVLDRYGAMGVAALASATPVESGVTANSWQYKVEHKRGQHSITWYNTNVNDGIPIVILIQYGHGTGTGGFVQGRDFINPVIKPLFDKIANDVWEQVRNA